MVGNSKGLAFSEASVLVLSDAHQILCSLDLVSTFSENGMLAFCTVAACAIAQYKNPSLSIPIRIKDLISRMTLEEKIGQMACIDGRFKLAPDFGKNLPGSVICLFGEPSQEAFDLARASPLQIPLLMGVDAIHGHSFWRGATIFPVQLALACSWNPLLVQKVAAATADEMAFTGVTWTFSPVLCIARDLRWGRVDETFGEDPFLISELGTAMIRGYETHGVMATAKHFVGYGETQGGRDASEADLSFRKLNSYFLRPFEAAVRAGVGTIMSSYQGIDGIPPIMHRWLLRTKLKGEWKFDGFVVTDWNSLGDAVNLQRLAPSFSSAAARSIMSGIDMFMTTPEFFDAAIDAVETGLLDIEYVDAAVERILRKKFELGLFENDRRVNVTRVSMQSRSHRDLALEAARQSLVLLQNDGILPLSPATEASILVVGANFEDWIAQNGDWSLGSGQDFRGQQPRDLTTVVLAGMSGRFTKATVTADRTVNWGASDPDLDRVLLLARKADLVLAVVGDHPKYIGERKSTATLELQCAQSLLLKGLANLTTPLIIDVISSKPLVLPKAALRRASAIIQQFSPGMLGGWAFAEVLAGDCNPGGRLPISIPRHVGQLPVFYNRVRGAHAVDYADMRGDAEWPFGFGLTYSTFEYVNASLDKRLYGKEDDIAIVVWVRNTSERDGVEVVQAYVADLITSATWPAQELKGYARMSIAAGKIAAAKIVVRAAECSIVNAEGVRVVEPGEFEMRVGASSTAIHFKIQFTIA
jgi:beta-glucosidase